MWISEQLHLLFQPSIHLFWALELFSLLQLWYFSLCTINCIIGPFRTELKGTLFFRSQIQDKLTQKSHPHCKTRQECVAQYIKTMRSVGNSFTENASVGHWLVPQKQKPLAISLLIACRAFLPSFPWYWKLLAHKLSSGLTDYSCMNSLWSENIFDVFISCWKKIFPPSWSAAISGALGGGYWMFLGGMSLKE